MTTAGPFTDGVANGNIGNGMLGVIGSKKQVLPPAVYRVDPSGRIDAVLEGKPDLVPNGIAFSPDYSKVYLCWGRNLAVAEVRRRQDRQPAHLHRLRGGRRQVRSRRPSRGRLWQCLVRFHCPWAMPASRSGTRRAS